MATFPQAAWKHLPCHLSPQLSKKDFQAYKYAAAVTQLLALLTMELRLSEQDGMQQNK